MTRLLAGRPMNRGSIFDATNADFSFSKQLSAALGPTHPTYAMVAGDYFTRGKVNGTCDH